MHYGLHLKYGFAVHTPPTARIGAMGFIIIVARIPTTGSIASLARIGAVGFIIKLARITFMGSMCRMAHTKKEKKGYFSFGHSIISVWFRYSCTYGTLVGRPTAFLAFIQ